MTLQKLIQLRQGTVALKVFKDAGSGKLLFSLDKDMGSRKVMGPLFAEDELYQVLDLMLDYDEWESGAFHGKPNRRARGTAWVSDEEAVRTEIQTAIEKAANETTPASREDEQTPHQQTDIQVLPALPEYSYVHTCPACGCHVASGSILPGGSVMTLCAWCSHVYYVEGV